MTIMAKGAPLRDIATAETVGTCPHCNQIVPVEVHINTDNIAYQGKCPSCGSFMRLEDRDDFANLGEPLGTSSSLFEK